MTALGHGSAWSPAPGAGRTLLSALGAGRGDVISLVGGGGKTSLALRLAAEATAAGLRAIFTVTTHIFPPEGLPVLFAVPAMPVLDGPGPWCVVGGPAPDGKLAGLPSDQAALLTDLCDIVIVEADGSRGLPFKYPLAHEPVIPACTTIVVPVAGASVVGQPLDASHVHRAEAMAAFLGVSTGLPVTPDIVASVLWNPAGATRGRPANARVVPAINQADSTERISAARAIGAALLKQGCPRILLTAAKAAEPVTAIVE